MLMILAISGRGNPCPIHGRIKGGCRIHLPLAAHKVPLSRSEGVQP